MADRPTTRTAQARPTALRNSRYHGQFAFKRECLPSPADYYAAAGIRLLGGGAWRNALCPFHQDTRPSMRVLIETGAFRCMVCGAKGGDVLAFQMLRHGQRFVDAAKALGAWQEVR